MTITATTTRATSSHYDTFTFSDGATVRQSGVLLCSQHGRRHCRHHKLAHDAIITKAASHEAAPATVEPDFPLLMNVEVEVAIGTAEMEAEGFTWSEGAQTWVRKPTQPALMMAQRAAVALPAVKPCCWRPCPPSSGWRPVTPIISACTPWRPPTWRKSAVWRRWRPCSAASIPLATRRAI